MATYNRTLDDYIKSVNGDFFNLRRVSSIEKYDGFEYLRYISVERYINMIEPNAEIITLSPEEQMTYKYRPKSLSKLLYQTENLYYLILLLNNTTVEKFTPVELKVIAASDRTLIEDIINLERRLKHI